MKRNTVYATMVRSEELPDHNCELAVSVRYSDSFESPVISLHDTVYDVEFNRGDNIYELDGRNARELARQLLTLAKMLDGRDE